MCDWAFVIAHGDDHDDLNLRELFDISAQVHTNLSSLPRDVEASQVILQKCENVINSCVQRIDTAGVVSRNEELDDVATDSIRRALLDHCHVVPIVDQFVGTLVHHWYRQRLYERASAPSLISERLAWLAGTSWHSSTLRK